MPDVKEFKRRLEAALESKTGWGRNDLKLVMDQIYVEMLEEKCNSTNNNNKE